MAYSVPLRPFYFVATPESEAERHGLLCGSGWDPPLTADGLRRARKLAKELEGKNRGIKGIFCSPLLRSIQAADCVHDEHSVRMTVLAGLAERGFGERERMPLAALTGFDPLAETPAGQGETLMSFEERVFGALRKALEAVGSPLLVSHLQVGRLLQMRLEAGSGLEAGKVYQFRPAQDGDWLRETVA